MEKKMGMMMINLSARPFAFRQKYLLVSFKREIAYHLLILRHFFPFHIPPIFFFSQPLPAIYLQLFAFTSPHIRKILRKCWNSARRAPRNFSSHGSAISLIITEKQLQTHTHTRWIFSLSLFLQLNTIFTVSSLAHER